MITDVEILRVILFLIFAAAFVGCLFESLEAAECAAKRAEHSDSAVLARAVPAGGSAALRMRYASFLEPPPAAACR